MKLIFSILFFISGTVSAADCGPWVADNSTSCGYGDMRTGVPWSRTCGVGVCTHVRHHPNQGAPCSETRVCLPRNMSAGSLNEGCAPWQEVKSDDTTAHCAGQRLRFWTRANQCATVGLGFPIHFCSMTEPPAHPVPPYNKSYFDPDLIP